jgi:hypothetical protein
VQAAEDIGSSVAGTCNQVIYRDEHRSADGANALVLKDPLKHTQRNDLQLNALTLGSSAPAASLESTLIFKLPKNRKIS